MAWIFMSVVRLPPSIVKREGSFHDLPISLRTAAPYSFGLEARMRKPAASSIVPDLSPRHAILAGLCATLVGIGLARFAYTPLIPALIAAQWFTPSAAAYLGAANLAGYLAGALLGRAMAAKLSPAAVLRAMLLLATATFFACAFPLSFLWFFAWRFAAGYAGGALMVLAAPSVLPHVPPHRRGLAGGIIFTGVGLGIAGSGTLVPLLLRFGLMETWLGLGALALLLTIIAWPGWPRGPAAVDIAAPAARASGARGGLALKGLYVAYGLNAFATVPHMIFLVDFIARGLAQGLDVGARYWVIFGLGALAGPVITGALADRIGFKAALRSAFVIQAVAVSLPLVSVHPASLALSSLIVGAFVPGIVPLVLGRVHELVHDEQDRRAGWSFATTAFAVGQAVAAYGFSYLFGHVDSHAALFALGLAAFAAALAIDLALGRRPA
jgi:predicted MFS family arabinose efflux permease